MRPIRPEAVRQHCSRHMPSSATLRPLLPRSLPNFVLCHPAMRSTSAQPLQPSSSDAAVIATNDDAFQSKIASMRVGYFRDPYLSAMAAQHSKLCISPNYDSASRFRRQPVINRGTFLRVIIKQRLVDAFISLAGETHKFDVVQVVSLGAGFDTFPFNLLDAHCSNSRESASSSESGKNPPSPSIRYVELDLGQVIKDKLLLSSDFLSNPSHHLFANVEKTDSHFHAFTDTIQPIQPGAHSDFPVSHYSLHACDLRDLEALERVLFTEANLDRSLPTLIIAEICLVYMAVAHSDAVINHLSQSFHGIATFLNVEQIGGDDDFGQKMDTNVAARGSPLLGMRVYKDLASQASRFKENGWTDCCPISMFQFSSRFVSRDLMLKLQRIEMLDEVEELNLLLQHYCVVVAVSRNLAGGERQLSAERLCDIMCESSLRGT